MSQQDRDELLEIYRKLKKESLERGHLLTAQDQQRMIYKLEKENEKN